MACTNGGKPKTANIESTGREKNDPMEDESTNVQITAGIEVPGDCEAVSSSPIKRKTNVHDQSGAGDGEETNDGSGSVDGDDSGDQSDEDVDKDDESTDDCGSDWEADSYDNCNPDDEDDDAPDEESREKLRRYTRQVYWSKGFHVDPENVPDDLLVGVRPFTDLKEPYAPHKSVGDLMERLVRLTFDKYNREKGTELEMVNVVKANVRMNYGPKYYITCMARESPDGEPKEYQVKVERKFTGACTRLKNHYILCRPAPQPK